MFPAFQNLRKMNTALPIQKSATGMLQPLVPSATQNTMNPNTKMMTQTFDRHANMDSATCGRILDLVSDLSIIENCNSFPVINMLYGLFDGYDYTDAIEADPLLDQLRDGGNDHMVKEILSITSIVKQYEKSNC